MDHSRLQELIQAECEVWRRKGTNVRYEHRPSREGYKSGNLEYGLEQGYAAECELVVVFDADFEPAPDFLVRSVPFLVHNPDLGCIMSNWEFSKADHQSINYVYQSLSGVFRSRQACLPALWHFTLVVLTHVGLNFMNLVLYHGHGQQQQQPKEQTYVYNGCYKCLVWY